MAPTHSNEEIIDAIDNNSQDAFNCGTEDNYDADSSQVMKEIEKTIKNVENEVAFIEEMMQVLKHVKTLSKELKNEPTHILYEDGTSRLRPNGEIIEKAHKLASACLDLGPLHYRSFFLQLFSVWECSMKKVWKLLVDAFVSKSTNKKEFLKKFHTKFSENWDGEVIDKKLESLLKEFGSGAMLHTFTLFENCFREEPKNFKLNSDTQFSAFIYGLRNLYSHNDHSDTFKIVGGRKSSCTFGNRLINAGAMGCVCLHNEITEDVSSKWFVSGAGNETWKKYFRVIDDSRTDFKKLFEKVSGVLTYILDRNQMLLVCTEMRKHAAQIKKICKDTLDRMSNANRSS